MKQNGFTLVEIALYIFMLGLILLSVMFFYQMAVQAKVKHSVVLNIESEGSRVSVMLSQLLRNAQAINFPAAGTSSGELSLETADGSTTPTLIDLSGGMVRIKEGSSPYVNLSSAKVTVSNLIFRNLSNDNTPGIIRIEFTVSDTSDSPRAEYNYSRDFSIAAGLRQ